MTAILAGVNLLLVVSLAAGTLGKLRTLYGHYDPLSVARCEVRCWDVRCKNSCIRSCLSKGDSKPGGCPLPNATLSPFAAACMQECHHDTQCGETAKCCRHSCGVTCQPANNLEFTKGLPDIPRDLNIVERRKKRAISIEWATDNRGEEIGGHVLYLIEERHHTGKHFQPEKLSDWSACSRAVKPRHNLRHCVKSGRWYQFRVAAVNTKGSRGFSNTSLPYSYSINPKAPQAPPNITVGPLEVENGCLHVKLKWSQPQSDLPIQKYKVFWSKRLHGAKALDSVLVNQHTVSSDQTFFMIHNLESNSQYFLQVQAIAQYGKEKLKGEKAGFVLNTTDFINSSDNNALVSDESQHKNKLEGVRLQKLFWHRNVLKARIVWTAKKNYVKYSVSWWTGSCHNVSKGYQPKYSATTKMAHFDLKDLQFDCRYKVSIREANDKGMKSTQDTSITFTTPKCTRFRSKNQKIKC